MSVILVREIAAVAAAVGLAVMLAPPRLVARVGVPDGPRRLAGLAVLLAAWVTMAASLAPSGVTNRLGTPVGAGMAIVGVVVALAVVVLLARLVARRPWVWFLLLGIALPVRIPVSLGGADANLLLPLYAVIVLGLGVWGWLARHDTGAAGERGSLRWRSTPLDLPLLLFVGFTLISLLWTSDVSESAVKITFFWIPFTLLYVVAAALWRNGRALRVLALTTMAMAVPVSLLALGEYASRQVLWNHRLEQANVYSRFFRVNAIFYDPNILGRYLALALVITVAVAWIHRASTRALILCGGAAAIYSAALIVTFSRSSALMLMVGLLILSLRMFGMRRTLAVAGCMAVVGAAGAILASGQVRSALTSSARLQKVSEGRFELVSGGVDLWKEHPVAGGGLGSFATDYSALLSRGELRRTRVVISHNAPVTVLSEEGLVGFALFAWLVVMAFVVGTRAARSEEASGIPGAAMLAILTGIVVHSLLYSALFEDPYTWVLAAGLVVLAANAPPREGAAGIPDSGTTT